MYGCGACDCAEREGMKPEEFPAEARGTRQSHLAFDLLRMLLKRATGHEAAQQHRAGALVRRDRGAGALTLEQLRWAREPLDPGDMPGHSRSSCVGRWYACSCRSWNGSRVAQRSCSRSEELKARHASPLRVGSVQDDERWRPSHSKRNGEPARRVRAVSAALLRDRMGDRRPRHQAKPLYVSILQRKCGGEAGSRTRTTCFLN